MVWLPVSTFLFLFSTLFYLFVQRIQEKLRSGKLSVSDDQWPIFLYRFYKFDSSDPWKGLLQSSILFKVSHIFLIKIISSFSFLIKDIQAYFYFPELSRKRGKIYQIWKCSYTWNYWSNTCIHCICSYTSMWYFFCFIFSKANLKYNFKARFALSSSSIFSKSNIITDSERFYYSLLKLLENPNATKKVDSLVAWWNW